MATLGYVGRLMKASGENDRNEAIMGFCDYVMLEQGCRVYGLTETSMFQTKSLYVGGAELTITRDGKLVEHM